MMIMSIGSDYISELWPPMGLLFIPQIIFEHGEALWNDIGMGIVLICPPELYCNPSNRII
jgi:hypothetical protein